MVRGRRTQIRSRPLDNEWPSRAIEGRVASRLVSQESSRKNYIKKYIKKKNGEKALSCCSSPFEASLASFFFSHSRKSFPSRVAVDAAGGGGGDFRRSLSLSLSLCLSLSPVVDNSGGGLTQGEIKLGGVTWSILDFGDGLHRGHNLTLGRKPQNSVIHSGKCFLDDSRTYLHRVAKLIKEETWDLPHPTPSGTIGGTLPD